MEMKRENIQGSELSSKLYAKKVYVTVRLLVRKDGCVRPLAIVWEDGMTYEVDRVLHITPAASLRVGGRGIRYTVSICGHERYLFEEEGRWFVEGNA